MSKKEKCPHCQAMRHPDDFISKDGTRRVKCCQKCRGSTANYTRKNLKWTEAQLAELEQLAPTMNRNQLAEHFNRTVSSVSNLLYRKSIVCMSAGSREALVQVEHRYSIEAMRNARWVG